MADEKELYLFNDIRVTSVLLMCEICR